ncbi:MULTISPECIES: hypothetical protein [unclassified Mameliella]|uniref:hypothetical protein n=1 Tax=unclassified Mameliella TaxID=2630630 RepID=UPI00273D9052|nr:MULTISPECIES: hypothetical protein [unclassified Mameliella]
MKGWRLFRHAFRMVWNNLNTALKVTGLLFAIQMVPQIWLMSQTDQNNLDASVDVAMGGSLLFLLWAIVALVAGIWMAVAWHRYVLTGEQSGTWLPIWRPRLVLGYLGRTILLGLLSILAFVVLGIPLGFIIAFLPLLMLPAMVVYLAFGLFVFFRLSLILPAVAMEKRMKLLASWDATGTDAGAVLGLSAIVAVVVAMLMFVSMIFAAISPFLGMVWTIGSGWLFSLVSITCMTTLYGVYVEGRDIP